MNYFAWLILRLRGQLWWKAVLYGLWGIVTAVVAMFAESYFPWRLPFELSREAVESLLAIISSSMLAVTTFTLGAMTSAFGAATSHVTPRATKLLMEDSVTHTVLSTFIGAFVFSIVSLIVLKTGSYGQSGRAVLFVITVLMLCLIVVQLLRWVNHLISLGRVGTTIERLEKQTASALLERQSQPYLGASPWYDKKILPLGAKALYSGQVGYVQFVDVSALSALCDERNLYCWLAVNPGALAYEDSVLLWVTGEFDSALAQRLLGQIILGASRSFEQDPRFGLAVLAEVGSRALSPATNDPGTALDIVSRQTRLLTLWAKGRDTAPVSYRRVHVHPLSDQDLFEDAFFLLARDGAHLIEIQLRLQKSLQALERLGSSKFKSAARVQADIAFERGSERLTNRKDKDLLQQAYQQQILK